MKKSKYITAIVILAVIVTVGSALLINKATPLIDYIKNVIFLNEIQSKADTGNKDAQFLLDILKNPVAAMQNTDSETYKSLKKDAENGTPEEQFTVGVVAYTQKNYDDAVAWLTKAAERGLYTRPIPPRKDVF